MASAVDITGAARSAKALLPAWLRAVAIAAAGVLIAATIWAVYSSELIVGDANHLNFHELEVAANGLEAWPNSLPGLAAANFINDNVEPAAADDRAGGWIGVAHVYHPRIGAYDLLYQVEAARPGGKPTDPPCTRLRETIEHRENIRMPFVAGTRAGEGPQLRVIGGIPVTELVIANRAVTEAPPKSDELVDPDGVFGKLGQPSPASGSTLCYASTVPIAKLLAFDRAEQPFTDLMIVDGDRRVVRQMGSRPVAVDTLDKLAPAGSILDAAFAKSGTDKADKTAKAETPPSRLADALKPVPLELAGESYLAYVRPFHLPPGVTGCEPVAKAESKLNLAFTVGDATVDGHGTVTSAKPTPADPPGATAPPQTCLLVGLMPNHSLMRSALTLSPLPLVILGFIAAIALALLPTVRLLLIGTGDGLPGYAVAGVVLGIPLAAGFATLALLFATDVVRERAGVRAEAVKVTEAMATAVQTGPDGGDRRSRRRRHHAQADRDARSRRER